VGHQTQVVLDQGISRLKIAVLRAAQTVLFLLAAQGLGKLAARGHAQKEPQRVHQQKKRAFDHVLTSPQHIPTRAVPMPRRGKNGKRGKLDTDARR
jgi:hypothetical protein